MEWIVLAMLTIFGLYLIFEDRRRSKKHGEEKK